MRIRRRPLHLAAPSGIPLPPKHPGRPRDGDVTGAAFSNCHTLEMRDVAVFHNCAAASTDVGILPYARCHFINRDPHDKITHDSFLSQRQCVGRLIPDHKNGVRRITCKINQREDQDSALLLPLVDEQVPGFGMPAKPQNGNEELMDGKCLISKLISSLKGLRRSRFASQKPGRFDKLEQKNSIITGQFTSVPGPTHVTSAQALQDPHPSIDGLHSESRPNQAKRLKLPEASTYNACRMKENENDVKKMTDAKQSKAKRDVKLDHADSMVANKDVVNATDASHAGEHGTSLGSDAARRPRWRKKCRPLFRSLARDVHRRAAPLRTNSSCPSLAERFIPSLSTSIPEDEHNKLHRQLCESSGCGEVFGNRIDVSAMSSPQQLKHPDEGDDDEWLLPSSKRPKSKSYDGSSKMERHPYGPAIVTNQEASKVAVVAAMASRDDKVPLSRKPMTTWRTVRFSSDAVHVNCNSKISSVDGLVIGGCVLNTDPVDWQSPM